MGLIHSERSRVTVNLGLHRPASSSTSQSESSWVELPFCNMAQPCCSLTLCVELFFRSSSSEISECEKSFGLFRTSVTFHFDHRNCPCAAVIYEGVAGETARKNQFSSVAIVSLLFAMFTLFLWYQQPGQSMYIGLRTLLIQWYTQVRPSAFNGYRLKFRKAFETNLSALKKPDLITICFWKMEIGLCEHTNDITAEAAR